MSNTNSLKLLSKKLSFLSSEAAKFGVQLSTCPGFWPDTQLPVVAQTPCCPPPLAANSPVLLGKTYVSLLQVHSRRLPLLPTYILAKLKDIAHRPSGSPQ